MAHLREKYSDIYKISIYHLPFTNIHIENKQHHLIPQKWISDFLRVLIFPKLMYHCINKNFNCLARQKQHKNSNNFTVTNPLIIYQTA